MLGLSSNASRYDADLIALWDADFKQVSAKKMYIVGTIAALLFPTTLIDIGEVQPERVELFIASRTIPSFIILLAMLAQRFIKRWKAHYTYYVTSSVIILGANFRINNNDFINFAFINAMAFGILAALPSFKIRHPLTVGILAVVFNILVYTQVYAEHIPASGSGILVVVALATIMIFANKFRYDTALKNFIASLMLKKQNEEIELQRQELLQLNQQMSLQKEEITMQRDSIMEKNNLLEEVLHQVELKTKNITASINYARRIQNSLLPLAEDLQKTFAGHFVLFRPRDIVSGDFYWYYEVNNHKILAVVDCTGHGVPGALMSIIAESALRQVAQNQEITRPDLILEHLDRNIRNILRQDSNSSSQDGMDIAICTIAEHEDKLWYAGAKNPLLLVKHDQLIHVKGDRRPIGGRQYYEGAFTLHEFCLSETDGFYLFTDGFADQFGGKEGRKFMIGNFRQLLADICTEAPSVQKQILTDRLNQWMHPDNGEKYWQVDDILVFGARFRLH
jgi:serine phosphatase RsbU (regulator of sigma subunit)